MSLSVNSHFTQNTLCSFQLSTTSLTTLVPSLPEAPGIRVHLYSLRVYLTEFYTSGGLLQKTACHPSTHTSLNAKAECSTQSRTENITNI